ncbi:DUF4062 domain-containing protein [Pedobacter sp. WC2501]|uniref:DUF4062 domain-containing protein n=1 Tax=Pedobacter sp. WC2501 TaxID=3461400 RepID=UPI0040454E70
MKFLKKNIVLIIVLKTILEKKSYRNALKQSTANAVNMVTHFLQRCIFFIDKMAKTYYFPRRQSSIKKQIDKNFMVPRFFVSSTYYDLKHVRERIEKFIESYGFEPVLFESDKVTYQHGQAIDHSAYYEVGLCHIMLLIVGGRYGSPSTNGSIEQQRKLYDDEFISITRKEFDTAVLQNIPVLVFIDQNVYAEYQTYKENQEFFDKTLKISDTHIETKQFKFAHVDHVNVFKFIDVVRGKAIKTFEKVEEIESYIKAQLSGMFYLYLESLKKTSDDKKILDTISELNNVTLRMNEMITSVGKEIFRDNKATYENVIESQLEIMLDFFRDKFASNIDFISVIPDDELDLINLDQVAELIYTKALKAELPKSTKNQKWSDWYHKNKTAIEAILENLQEELALWSPKLALKDFNLEPLNNDLKIKVLPFIKNDADEKRIIEKIRKVIEDKLTDLPF